MLGYLLLRITYYGKQYRGFQIQPDVPTVQGIVSQAFRLLGLGGTLKYISRTDAGVSAVDQIIIKKLDQKFFGSPIYTMIRRISEILPDNIRVYAYTVVKNSIFSKIRYKEYLYLISRELINLDPHVLSDVIRYINNNTCNYFYLVKRPVGSIEDYWLRYSIESWCDSEYIYIKVRGKKFYWEQVRRLISLLVNVAMKRIAFDTYTKILNGKPYRCGVPPAPAAGLVLWRIRTDYDDRFIYLESYDSIENWLLNKIKGDIKNVRWVYMCKEK